MMMAKGYCKPTRSQPSVCGSSSKPQHSPVQEAVPPPPRSRGGGWNLNGRRGIDVSDSPVKETLYLTFQLGPGHLLTL